MTATPYSSYGCLVKRGNGGDPEMFATIAGLMDINPPEEEARTEEYVLHDGDGAVHRLATVIDAGEADFEMAFDQAGTSETDLRSDLRAKVVRNFQFHFSNTAGTIATVGALVKKISTPMPVEGMMKATVTLAFSGLPVYS